MLVSFRYIDGWCCFHHGAQTPIWVAGGDHLIINHDLREEKRFPFDRHKWKLINPQIEDHLDHLWVAFFLFIRVSNNFAFQPN
jgi:hypothetical protein